MRHDRGLSIQGGKVRDMAWTISGRKNSKRIGPRWGQTSECRRLCGGLKEAISSAPGVRYMASGLQTVPFDLFAQRGPAQAKDLGGLDLVPAGLFEHATQKNFLDGIHNLIVYAFL